MIFTTYDMEKDLESQGYKERSFDLVVAANVLHATADLDAVLSRVRKLLKPGGYLVLLEITNSEPRRLAYVMGGLPGWWLGHTNGRTWSPTLRAAQWNSLLQRTGFSGIDTIVSHPNPVVNPFSVVATQALDDRISFFRQPLYSPSNVQDLGDLVLVGGKDLRSSKLIGDIGKILARRFASFTVYESLEDLNHVPEIPVPTTILSLTELDEPMFKDMTAEKLQALQKLFKDNQNILWVTTGCRTDEPYSNMVVGFGRSLSCELQELRLQLLDFEDHVIDSTMLSEAVLRLCMSGIWEKDGLATTTLWSTEPEIVIKNGKHLIPRLYLQKSQNHGYNSRKRNIIKAVNHQTRPVSISHTGRSYSLLEDGETKHQSADTRTRDITVQVYASLLNAVTLGKFGSVFILVGRTIDSDEVVCVLSATNTSIVVVHEEDVFHTDVVPGHEKQLLLHIASEMIAHLVMVASSNSGSVLVKGAKAFLLDALRRHGDARKRPVVWLSTDPDCQDPSALIFHPLAFAKSIKKKLPSDLSAYINVTDETDDGGWHDRLVASLPSNCSVLTNTDLFARSIEQDFFLSDTGDSLRHVVRKACSDAGGIVKKHSYPVEDLIMPLSEIQQGPAKGPFTVIDWTIDTFARVSIEPVDSKISLSPDRTYWLVGLTGDLGLSLCEWFIRHGARFVVLSSRNPKVDKKWLETSQIDGVSIKVIAAYVLIPQCILAFIDSRRDVSDKKSINTAHDEICRTLPPIAGVTNAAMVLEDVMFANMKISDMLPVLKPKVEGSQYLDELFTHTDLDFFILFSSLGLQVGNSGQSTYVAANGYLTTLAAQRRKRGLPASVIAIGAIVGAGYITRAGTLKTADIQAYGAYALSESDFHYLFAEAILASPLDSLRNPEIITGLRMVDPIREDRVTWRNNPKFSHLWIMDIDPKGGKGLIDTYIPVKQQLLTACTKEEARLLIQGD